MCHVLIIEDDWFAVEELAGLATRAGATSIDRAPTEGRAVQAAYERRPGIIVSDVELLVGTGPGAVAAITLASGEIPVIYVTAHPAACPPPAAHTTVLTKPVDAARFIEAFRRLAPL